MLHCRWNFWNRAMSFCLEARRETKIVVNFLEKQKKETDWNIRECTFGSKWDRTYFSGKKFSCKMMHSNACCSHGNDSFWCFLCIRTWSKCFVLSAFYFLLEVPQNRICIALQNSAYLCPQESNEKTRWQWELSGYGSSEPTVSLVIRNKAGRLSNFHLLNLRW